MSKAGNETSMQLLNQKQVKTAQVNGHSVLVGSKHSASNFFRRSLDHVQLAFSSVAVPALSLSKPLNLQHVAAFIDAEKNYYDCSIANRLST